MKVVVTLKNEKELKLNKSILESIRKILNRDIVIRYSKSVASGKKKLSSLAGLCSMGGDSVKDSDEYYE